MVAANSFQDREYRECFLLYTMGWRPVEIEEECGISADKINHWVMRDKWKAQKEAAEQAEIRKHPPSQSPILKAVASARKEELRQKFLEDMGVIAAEDAGHWKQLDPQERLVVAPAITSLAGVHRKTLELDKEEENDERGHISLSFLCNPTEKVTILDVQSEKIALPPATSTDPDDY